MTVLTGVISQSSVKRGKEDGFKNARMMRDGTISIIPWIEALVLEGKVYGAAPGATALGVAAGSFGAGAIDTDEFDYLQTVPATVAVKPIYIRVCLVTIGTAAEAGYHAFWGAAGVTGANSVAVTPHNLLTNSTNTSACTVSTLGDDGGTTFVPAGLIARDVVMGITPNITATTAIGSTFIPAWSAASAGYSPTITGLVSPGRQISIWANAQAAAGYIHHVFAEFDIDEIA